MKPSNSLLILIPLFKVNFKCRSDQQIEMSFAGKEFVLTDVVKNISSLKEGQNYYSEVEEHFDVPWQMNIERKDGFLGFYLLCEKPFESQKWAIETGHDLKITSVNGKSLVNSYDGCYKNDRDRGWGWDEFIKWEEMEKDYVVDDKLIIEAHVKIEKMTGIEKKKLRNFDETMKEFSDIVLVVNDEKFYVSKLFLASQSTYFKALLLGNFKESGIPEVTLTDINSSDFQNFLEVLHAESAIDDDTVDGILRLADMYDAQIGVKRCEEFLIRDSRKSLKEKLQISTRYNMQHLKNSCLVKIKTIEDIRSVMPGDINEMGPSVARALLQKSVSIQ